jgi:HEPN domain-containing protein
MPDHKNSETLMGKAGQDEFILDLILNNASAPEEVFGFHAQQAAEKMLKAVLASQNIEYPFSHNIRLLFKLIIKQGIQLPERFYALRHLTPFAGEFRYDVLPDEPEGPINKIEIRAMIHELRAWVEEFLSRQS